MGTVIERLRKDVTENVMKL